MALYVDPVLRGVREAPWGFYSELTGPTGPQGIPGVAAFQGATGDTGPTERPRSFLALKAIQVTQVLLRWFQALEEIQDGQVLAASKGSAW